MYKYCVVRRLTCISLPLQSRWLYCGSDKGNVFTVSLEKFELSGYVIHWNKAIDMCVCAAPTTRLTFSDFSGRPSRAAPPPLPRALLCCRPVPSRSARRRGAMQCAR